MADAVKKTILVTGGSRGLGEFMAKGFLQAGASRVYITARNAEDCQATAEHLTQYGECIALPGNLSSMEEIKALVAELSRREPAIHVLVNNAGGGGAKPFDMPMETFIWAYQLNVFSVFHLCQLCAPHMAAEGGGAILNISSMRCEM